MCADTVRLHFVGERHMKQEDGRVPWEEMLQAMAIDASWNTFGQTCIAPANYNLPPLPHTGHFVSQFAKQRLPGCVEHLLEENHR